MPNVEMAHMAKEFSPALGYSSKYFGLFWGIGGVLFYGSGVPHMER